MAILDPDFDGFNFGAKCAWHSELDGGDWAWIRVVIRSEEDRVATRAKSDVTRALGALRKGANASDFELALEAFPSGWSPPPYPFSLSWLLELLNAFGLHPISYDRNEHRDLAVGEGVGCQS